MDMDQAAVFFAGSILTALGFLVWIIVILLVNNLVAKYWKSWGWSWMKLFPDHPPARFLSPEEVEKIPPTLDDSVKENKKAQQ
jgi:hypothetical protein